MSEHPKNEIRAVYDDRIIRVYQAYSDDIADKALCNGTFVSPPFKIDRMTWIKPSFLWMMYRAGWGYKDDGQRRILAIAIRREGLDWALAHSCPSHPGATMNPEQWKRDLMTSPVRVQWDPERNIRLEPLPYRSIQIGLGKLAVGLYVNEWIQKIVDITDTAHAIHALLKDNKVEEAKTLLPVELPYPYLPSNSCAT